MGELSEKAREYLTLPKKINVLSTSNKASENNIAMFGSFVLSDDSTMMVLLGDNRSYANLKENPLAALLVMAPETSGMQTEGCRVYLKAMSMEDSGETFDRVKEGVRARVGDAAESLKHLVIFQVLGSRPIVDMGLGI